MRGRSTIRTVNALSCSRPLLGSFTVATQTWSTYSVHDHAYNLRTTDGNLCALVTPWHGNGPFHIVLSAAAFADFAHDHQPSDPVMFTSAQLQSMVQGASRWEPRLPSVPSFRPPAELLVQLQTYPLQLATLLVETTPERWQLLPRVEQGIDCMKAGLQKNAPWLLARGVEQLVGLGPGLTPLGDDLLIGMLGGLYLAPPLKFGDAIMPGFQRGIKLERTTHLSALWLHHALCGEFGEAWHQLAGALTVGSPDQVYGAFTRIAASGATSGLAALSGLYHCWKSLAEAG